MVTAAAVVSGVTPLWCGVIALMMLRYSAAAAAATVQDGDKSSAVAANKSVDEFLTSLTQMITSALDSDARYSDLLGGDANDLHLLQQDSISGRPNQPSDYFDTGRPQAYPPPYFENGPPNLFPDQPLGPGFRPGFRPPYPYRPPGLGPAGYFQQNSVLQALSSISHHDDLRCVPRLLCEVSSGTRPSSSYYQPGYYQQQQQQSSIPFLSKDALITLLTVLNFVDDSPLLMFGRAALLGYNARGDPRSCTTAYPTCPRDPDQLINYLNNHNGGFFRFFNQQLPQYAPQYAVHQRPTYQQQQHPPYQQQPSYQQYLQRPQYQQPGYQQYQQYAPQYQRPSGQQFYTSRSDLFGATAAGQVMQRPRILSGTASQYFDVPAVQDLPLDVSGSSRPSATFPYETVRPMADHSGAANSVAPFVFPSDDRRQSKRVKMIFPDRKGTGGLRADLDANGNYKGVYYADGAIKFVDSDNGGDDQRDRENHRRPPSRIRLPYNRLAYQDRKTTFQFPKTDA